MYYINNRFYQILMQRDTFKMMIQIWHMIGNIIYLFLIQLKICQSQHIDIKWKTFCQNNYINQQILSF